MEDRDRPHIEVFPGSFVGDGDARRMLKCRKTIAELDLLLGEIAGSKKVAWVMMELA